MPCPWPLLSINIPYSQQLEQLANGERQVVLEPYLRPEEAAPPPSRRFYPKEVLATGDALVLPVMAITGNSCCVMDITSWRNGSVDGCGLERWFLLPQ